MNTFPKLVHRPPVSAWFAGFIVVLADPVGISATATTPASPRYTIAQFMRTTNYYNGSFFADEKRMLLTSDESGTLNACWVSTDGGPLTPLLPPGNESTFGVSCFPSDDRILVRRDQGGNEQNHSLVRELDGTLRDLTPGDKLQASFVRWSKDLKSFYISSNERDPRKIDLYRYQADDYSRQLVYQNDDGYILGEISPDDRFIALHKWRTATDVECSVLDLTTGTLIPILPHPDRDARVESAAFSPDSQSLLVLTDDEREFTRVVQVELATGKVTEVEKAEWGIVSCRFSETGRYRITQINHDGSMVVRLFDQKANREVPLPSLPVGEMRGLRFSRSETKAAFYVNGDRSPPNLWFWDLETGEARPLTRSLSPEIAPEDLVDSRIVRFKSFDGLDIPSVFYLPKNASPTNKVPAVVLVHGGPGGQKRVGYDAEVQFLVHHGYAILGINHRGSSGYGKSFLAADDGRHGREPLWDCVEAKTFLATMPEIDAERIGIMGGSYGGYMVLAALAYRPEAFKCGIDLFGVSNWLRALESIAPQYAAYRDAFYLEMGDPVKDPERVRAMSPLFAADQIRMPPARDSGANDPRVLQEESDDIVAAVQKNGVPVEYVVFDDEGRGFRKKKNQEVACERILAFLDRHLKHH